MVKTRAAECERASKRTMETHDVLSKLVDIVSCNKGRRNQGMIAESSATQALKSFSSDRSILREQSDRLLNALVQVNNANRKTFKMLAPGWIP